MTAVCLDTSAYSAFKRGDAEVRSYLERADRILVPTVVLGELRAGFASGSRQAQNLRDLSQFLAIPGCEIAVIDEGVSRRYADTDKRHMDRRSGTRYRERGSHSGSSFLLRADPAASSLKRVQPLAQADNVSYHDSRKNSAGDTA